MDLSYLNTRIRGWKSKFLSKNQYDELINTGDIKGLINHLRETTYGRDIEIAAARYKTDRDIAEGSLKENLTNILKKLWDCAPDEARNLIRVIYSIWDVYNLKTILRAKNKGISSDDSISILMPAGDLDEGALKELNQQKGIDEVVALLSIWGSPYTKPIKDVMPQYMQEKHIAILELALDRFVYDYGRSIISDRYPFNMQIGLNRNIVKQVLIDRIDSINISTLLKLFREKVSAIDIEGYFLEGGKRFDKEDFLRIAKDIDKIDIKELLKRIAALVKDSHWKKAIDSMEIEDVFFIEDEFEELSRQYIYRFAIIEPLSIALSVYFIYTKIREIKNLRLIAAAKAFNIPNIEIKRFMIYV